MHVGCVSRQAINGQMSRCVRGNQKANRLFRVSFKRERSGYWANDTVLAYRNYRALPVVVRLKVTKRRTNKRSQKREHDSRDYKVPVLRVRQQYTIILYCILARRERGNGERAGAACAPKIMAWRVRCVVLVVQSSSYYYTNHALTCLT